MATTKVRRGWHPWAILCALGSLTLVGCGGVKGVPVAGTVTLDGQPLNGVTVTFFPDTTKGNTAPISGIGEAKEGRYELRTTGVTRSDSGSGVPPGWYKVTVIEMDNFQPQVLIEIDDKNRGRPQLQRAQRAALRAKLREQAQLQINAKYQSVEKTPLEVEVKDNPEPGAYDFKLTH